MQIPILDGIYTDGDADFRVARPRNMVPIPLDQGISKGYLRPAEGIIGFDKIGPGAVRGGINWEGVCYRVMGSKLVSQAEDGTLTTLGDVGNDGKFVTMDYSFDRLSITSNNNLFYYSSSLGLIQVTDPDLGVALDHIWVDGYFMTTDGENLVVTDLADPLSVNPLKYGSSEADPDPVVALKKIKNEPYAINRYTIEVFDNIGGTGFPFGRIEGAQIEVGAVGTRACCTIDDAIVLVGGGRNEGIGVWICSAGQRARISDRDIDQRLNEYTESELANIFIEPRIGTDRREVLIHLEDVTLVYDLVTSQALGTRVWYILTSSSTETETAYRARCLVRCYNRWLVGDTTTNEVGYLSESISSHWSSDVRWEFSTQIIYNDGNGALIHELELVCLTGRVALGVDPTIYTQYSLDGQNWSMLKGIPAGKIGERNKRLVWLGQGDIDHWRIQRFFGQSSAYLSCARCEARIEPLFV